MAGHDCSLSVEPGSSPGCCRAAPLIGLQPSGDALDATAITGDTPAS